MSTVFVLHLIVILCSSLLAYAGVNRTMKCKKKVFRLNGYYLLSFIILLFFIGFREFLGRDWDNYERIVNNPLQAFAFGESRELGFLGLVSFIKAFDLNFQFFIFITSFLTLYLFFRSIKSLYYLLPLSIVVFFLFWPYQMTINTIRQGIAIFAFMNALLYVDEKKWKFFMLWMLFGALFHYSCLVFLPCYFVGRLNFNLRKLILTCIVIFGVSFMLLSRVYDFVLMSVPKYESYIGDDHVYASNSTFGLGALLMLILRLTPLLHYNLVIHRCKQLTKYYVLYYLGISIYYAFYKYLIITRFTFYFQFCELFVISSFLYYGWKFSNSGKFTTILYMSLAVFNYIYTFQDFLIDQAVEINIKLFFITFTI